MIQGCLHQRHQSYQPKELANDEILDGNPLLLGLHTPPLREGVLLDDSSIFFCFGYAYAYAMNGRWTWI